MPTVRTYDDVDTLYKLNEDGESSRSITVLGKDAYDKALADGWTDISKLPYLPFPKAVRRPNGEVLRVENRAELEEALSSCRPDCPPGCRKHGWETKIYAAPPVPPEFFAEPTVAPGSKPKIDVDLALQLVAANTRAMEQDKKIEALMAQNAQILEVLAKKGK